MTRPMVVVNTPVEDHGGLWVKREDLSCPGGPNFSKTRGVWAHVSTRPERVVGVLDTAHSQGGWAVARACQMLGKSCALFYPVRKAEADAPLKPQQREAQVLGAHLFALQAGRSAVIYHSAKKRLPPGAYMMPNALKLPEMVEETALEFGRTELPDGLQRIIVPASSATIAAGVLLGISRTNWRGVLVVHLGYSRPVSAVVRYMERMSGVTDLTRDNLVVVDEGYTYADEAREGAVPDWPCNTYYDLKAYRWWAREPVTGTMLWNVG